MTSLKSLKILLLMKLKNLKKIISKLITLKYKSKRQSSIITVKGKDVTNPKNIADTFNNIFIKIGPKTVPKSKQKFKKFFNNFLLNFFVLKPVTQDEVRKAMSQLTLIRLGFLKVVLPGEGQFHSPFIFQDELFSI